MKHKISIAVCVLLIAVTVGFVFNNSSKPTAESQQASAVVAETIEEVAQKTNSNETQTTLVSVRYLRKAAHAVEFFALGLELAAFSLLVGRRKYSFQKLGMCFRCRFWWRWRMSRFRFSPAAGRKCVMC